MGFIDLCPYEACCATCLLSHSLRGVFPDVALYQHAVGAPALLRPGHWEVALGDAIQGGTAGASSCGHLVLSGLEAKAAVENGHCRGGGRKAWLFRFALLP